MDMSKLTQKSQEALQQSGDDPFWLVEQGEQKVLAVGFGLASAYGLALRLLQRLL